MSITLTAREARPASGLILLTMSLGVMIAQIDTSVVNLAAKSIGTDMKASVTELQWVVDVYNFVYASLLLTAGTLADLYGRRRIFAFGIALFTLGTVVCGLAPDVPTLVAGRAVAGLGAALEVPASLAILTIAYPDTKERTRALGIWASCYGIAIVIGPTAGGALVDASGWRSIFLLIIPFCLVTLVLVMTVVPESSNPQGRRLDLPGQALAIASLGSLSLAAIEGPRWGWISTGSLEQPWRSRLSDATHCARRRKEYGSEKARLCFSFEETPRENCHGTASQSALVQDEEVSPKGRLASGCVGR
jgi:MFS transporter, DHA2 family, methylenomycin A resistance protein